MSTEKDDPRTKRRTTEGARERLPSGLVFLGPEANRVGPGLSKETSLFVAYGPSTLVGFDLERPVNRIQKGKFIELFTFYLSNAISF